VKGDPCFSRDPIRTVFKTVGSLFCWRLEVEWLNQNRSCGQIENTLLPALVSASLNGVDTAKTWARWRSYSNSESAFAGGKLDIVDNLIDHSVELKLIKKGLAKSCKAFFKLLSELGRDAFSRDPDELDSDLQQAHDIICELAEIDLVLFTDTIVDRWTGGTFTPESPPLNNDLRDRVIDSALASLRAMEKLELAIKTANGALGGEKIGDYADPILVRELLLSKYRDDAVYLVESLHKSLRLTFRANEKPVTDTITEVKKLVTRMNREARNLQLESDRRWADSQT
jgi:hypothetical protein